MPVVRTSTQADLEAIRACHLDAFGTQEGPEIVELVSALLKDETAQPLLSLVAESEGAVIGHVLFTAVRLESAGSGPKACIMAPLGVAGSHQGQGVGSTLIEEGLNRLQASGTELVFVLGHPDYYPRYGFRPAGALGFEAPYTIAPENAAAWMVLALPPAETSAFRGKVKCSQALSDPKYWQE